MSHLYESSKDLYDAFGRLKVANPLTLFDSSHRYRDNNLWSTIAVGAGSTYSFNQNQGLVELTVGTGATCQIVRETTKVFAYQPGKGLSILNTGVMNSPKPNLRQRIGYFGSDNGIYFEQDGTTVNIVERSIVTGIVSETRVPQSQWNVDTLTGVGVSNPSGIMLDISKAQIFWTDIEWLGEGTVRTGFVIDGKYVHAHSFHHANLIETTYITTASLPLRYEIANTGVTTSGSTLKQVCSTVISEGGYELRGLQQAIGTSIMSPVNLPLAGILYPIISIRLKTSPNRLDAIVILTALSMMGITNNSNYNWKVIASGITTGGVWTDAGLDSAVEYKINGAAVTGGRVLASGYFSASNQANPNIDILKEALFKFQLERNGLTRVPFELTVAAAASAANSDIHASVDWEEISR
jgi:hypothetical protein